jgi:WD40 repeat protein
MVSISSDECILRDLSAYEKKRSLFAKSSRFSSGCFAPNGEELVTVFEDKTVCVWSLSSFDVVSKVTLSEPSTRS